jgi:hypoxanthine-DNA glycosylase
LQTNSDKILHPFPPLYNKNSRILILGSFPSVKSREQMFFYGHPQNRFWKVLSGIFNSERPETIEEKREFLLSHKIALWDVIASCRIEGSADSSIRDAVPNDLSGILDNADIKKIFVNGRAAEKYYNKYTKPIVKSEAVCLPSTSPANAAWTIDRLTSAWKIIREYTE